MKELDWFIVMFLILVGLICLTMSASTMMDTISMSSYFKKFVQICLWIGIPILLTELIYRLIKKKKKDL